MDTVNWIKILDEVNSISDSVNILWKSKNQTILPLAMGKY